MYVLAIVIVMVLSVALALAAAAGFLALILYVIGRLAPLRWASDVASPAASDSPRVVAVRRSRELQPATVPAGR